MYYLIQFLILVVFFQFINFYLIKKNILIDNYNNFKHKGFVNQDLVPISGGILIILNIFFFFPEFDLFQKILFFLVFLLGILSDIEKLKSPLVRLILQIILSLLFIISSNIIVNNINIEFIDHLLLNYFFIKIFLTIFCIVILVNGLNFIDGVNTLAIGYLIIVLLNLLLVAEKYDLVINESIIYKILLSLVIFFFYNLFSKSFLGDGGSYLLSFFVGFLIIEFVNFNRTLSPYYVVLILWYPAFENLFSICRRFFSRKKNIKYADNLHLHHLLFFYLSKKFKLKKKISNSLSGLIINAFNLLIIFIGSFFVYDTKYLVFLVFCAVIIYLINYFRLNFFFKN